MDYEASISTRVILTALAVFALAGSALASAAGATSTTTCNPGVRMIDGAMARVFCGPAKATVHAGGKTLVFAGGLCEKSGGGYAVNLGTFTLKSTSKRAYFGLLIDKPKPGKYTRQSLSYRLNGVRRSVFANVTLKTLKGGTFSGANSNGPVTGSFSC
jgi:hypothetical protein